LLPLFLIGLLIGSFLLKIKLSYSIDKAKYSKKHHNFYLTFLDFIIYNDAKYFKNDNDRA